MEAPATSRHTRHPLWLLPSGPDQVHELVLREDQGLHRASLVCTKEWEGLSSIDCFIASLIPSYVSVYESIDYQLVKSINYIAILVASHEKGSQRIPAYTFLHTLLDLSDA